MFVNLLSILLLISKMALFTRQRYGRRPDSIIANEMVRKMKPHASVSIVRYIRLTSIIFPDFERMYSRSFSLPLLNTETLLW